MRDWWFGVYSWWRGQLVGCDDFGNRYYEHRKYSNKSLKYRRWVVYKGFEDASKVPADWHGWLHYRTDELPAIDQPYSWIKPHLPNLTGTNLSPRSKRQFPQTAKDYESWRP
ncbi:NADH-ubiquinone oxidoreductase subunit NDUFA12 family protein [Candidatus Finniella inopinata]|uniref:NADH:ubiquinone oxidoreductase subunit NDUFA12 n=1 Tax=Candidatus Finniella inopinata TaxID=1696036 RepID=A0A4V2E025_9PROT|nr:NADH-ubiquinone oxidoreductase subunit NDUFA12 family protein [Candidatus Finniella inopinata]RZI47077.1 NADH:ubiquinone oxidoreductase subunit NDUFA12 [Candidatus Finniella inopinata]